MSDDLERLRQAIDHRREVAAEAAKETLKAAWDACKPLIELGEERIRTLQAVSEMYTPFLAKIEDIDVTEMMAAGSLQWSQNFAKARDQLRQLLLPKRTRQIEKSLAELRSLDPSAPDFPSRFLSLKNYFEVETSGVAESAAAAKNEIDRALKNYSSFAAGRGDRVVGYVSPEPVQTVQRNVKPDINVKR